MLMLAAALVLLSCGVPVRGRLAPSQTCVAPALPRSEGRRAYPDRVITNCAEWNVAGPVVRIYEHVCFANYTYLIPCDNKTGELAVEWAGHVMGRWVTHAEMDQLLATHPSDWLPGTSYSTAVLYFPHAAQALLGMLNVPLLGEPLERFVASQFDARSQPRTWQQHYEMFHKVRFLTDLYAALAECLGVTAKRGDEAFFHDYLSTAPPHPILPPRATPPRLLCFDKLVIPQNFQTCDQHFVDPRRGKAMWSAFRSHVFARYRVPPLLRTPIRIGFLERLPNRRITNQAEVVAAVRTATEAEVVVFHFPEDAGLDVQVRTVAGFHVLIAVHGEELQAGLFLNRGAVLVELYTRDYTKLCYHEELCLAYGIPYIPFCGPSGPCQRKVHWSEDYDKADVAINAEALGKVAVKAVRQWESARNRRSIAPVPA
eukprot:TRINITY_DN10873_c0_g1_i1.p1 TRINITY_DN10873_c0_g1~~TRINITY_DN10873_c0_g1_i1.p1  ORF type:complete len:428 (+),score=137.70 TRINITY_DN10873_c0_g1_i1:50-1333(+)